MQSLKTTHPHAEFLNDTLMHNNTLIEKSELDCSGWQEASLKEVINDVDGYFCFRIKKNTNAHPFANGREFQSLLALF